MNEALLSKTVYEKLIAHLTEVEEERNKIFDRYFPEPSKNRHDFEDLYETYIERLKDLVEHAQKSNEHDLSVPFVVIGSIVKVRDLTDKEVFDYRIMNPSIHGIGTGDVSCLSPVGKSLLLKKPGDKVTINAPGGVFHYKIISIRLDEKLDSLHVLETF